MDCLDKSFVNSVRNPTEVSRGLQSMPQLVHLLNLANIRTNCVKPLRWEAYVEELLQDPRSQMSQVPKLEMFLRTKLNMNKI